MEKIIKNFVCTDPDSAQYCKKISDSEYLYVEVREVPEKYVVCSLTVNLKDYTLDEIWNYCEAYYSSFEEMVENYGFRTSFQIMAECIFESLLLFDMDSIKSFDEEEDAIEYIKDFVAKND